MIAIRALGNFTCCYRPSVVDFSPGEDTKHTHPSRRQRDANKEGDMPHVKGFGRIGLDLVGVSRRELERISGVSEGYWWDKIPKGHPPTPEERPFTFSPETDRTWVSFLF